jgi:hypothetical protein
LITYPGLTLPDLIHTTQVWRWRNLTDHSAWFCWLSFNNFLQSMNKCSTLDNFNCWLNDDRKISYCWNVFIKICKDFTSSFCDRLSSYSLDFCPALWRWPQTLVKLSPLWWVTKKQVVQWAPLNGIKLNQMYQSKITLLDLSYVSSSFAYCYQFGSGPKWSF